MRYTFYSFVFLNGIFYRDFSYVHFSVGGVKIYITEIVLMVITLMWIARIMLSSKIGMEKILYHHWFALWVFGFWAIAAFWHSNYGDMLLSIRQFASVYYAWFAVLTIALFRRDNDFYQLMYILVTAALISVGVIFFRYLSGISLEVTTTPEVYRYGNYETVGILFLMAWLLIRPFRLIKMESWLRMTMIFLAAWAVIVLVQHRSATIALVITMGFMLIYGNTQKHKSIRMAIFAIPVLILLFVIPHAKNLIQGTLDRIASITSPLGSDANITWRSVVWVHALKSMTPIQYLIGVGWGVRIPVLEFSGKLYGYDNDIGMHNSLMFYFYHLGAVGVLLFLWMIVGLYLRALRVMRSVPEKPAREVQALLAANLGILVFSLFNVVLEGPYMGSVFWITLGMMWLKMRQAKALTAQHSPHRRAIGYYEKTV